MMLQLYINKFLLIIIIIHYNNNNHDKNIKYPSHNWAFFSVPLRCSFILFGKAPCSFVGFGKRSVREEEKAGEKGRYKRLVREGSPLS